jgi:hypothetical protein
VIAVELAVEQNDVVADAFHAEIGERPGGGDWTARIGSMLLTALERGSIGHFRSFLMYAQQTKKRARRPRRLEVLHIASVLLR